MTEQRPSDRDSLFDQLRELPDPDLPAKAHDDIKRRARLVLASQSRAPRWWVSSMRAWSQVGVPAVLAAAGLFYLVAGLSQLARIYGPDEAAIAHAPPRTGPALAYVATRADRDPR